MQKDADDKEEKKSTLRQRVRKMMREIHGSRFIPYPYGVDYDYEKGKEKEIIAELDEEKV